MSFFEGCIFAQSLPMGLYMALGACAVLTYCIPLLGHADVVTVDPTQNPEILLSEDEAQRLRSLVDTTLVRLSSDFSTNGRYLVVQDSKSDWSFLDTRRRRRTFFSIASSDYRPLTEMRWKDSKSVQFIAMNADQEFVSVEVMRRSGEAKVQPIMLPGFPLSLSTDGEKLMIVRSVQASRFSPYSGETERFPVIEIKSSRYNKLGDGEGDWKVLWQDGRRRVVSAFEVELSVVHLSSGAQESLFQVPENIAIGPWDWSERGNRLGVVIGEKVDNRRGGVVATEDVTVQDSLGKLSSFNNPFLSRNALELFRFRSNGKKTIRNTVKPSSDGIFADVSWGPWGLQLIARLRQPGQPDGRNYLTYANPNRSFYRLYSSGGTPFRTIRNENLGSFYGSAKFNSPFSILFLAMDGQSQSLFQYNIWKNEARRVELPSGSVNSAWLATTKGEGGIYL